MNNFSNMGNRAVHKVDAVFNLILKVNGLRQPGYNALPDHPGVEYDQRGNF